MGTFDNITLDKQEIKYQLNENHPSVNPAAKLFTEQIETVEVVTKLVSRQIAGAMIWGSAEFGLWGTAEWGDGTGGSFILNSSEFGILGTNKLGAGGSSEVLYAVVPKDNIFVEYFGQDEYINTTNSTGVLDTSAETYTIDPGEILESEVIAKLRVPITNIKFVENADFIDTGDQATFPFELGVDTFGESNARIEVSNDSGVTWYDVDEDVSYTFTTSANTDELKYRVTNSGLDAITISTPIVIEVNK